VREDRACDWACDCSGELALLGEGMLEVERMRVRARSARWIDNWLLPEGRFAIFEIFEYASHNSSRWFSASSEFDGAAGLIN
jgi:hypothetical protein